MEAHSLKELPFRRSRFSITDLMWFTAAVGATLVFTRGMLPETSSVAPSVQPGDVLVLTISSGLVFLFSFGAVFGKTWKSRASAIGIFSLLLLMGNLFVWDLVAWLGIGILLSFVLARVVRTKSLHLQLLVGWLFGSALMASMLNHYFPSSRVRQLLVARQAYPIVDLSPRLVSVSTVLTDSHVEFSLNSSENSLNQELNRFYDSPKDRNWRSRFLQQVHDRQYEKFVRSLGFGSMRMATIGRRRIDLAEVVDIEFDAAEPNDKSEDYLLDPILTDGERYEFAAVPRSFPELQKRSHLDFLNPATFGWVAEPKKVAGFEPHAFRFPIPRILVKDTVYSIRRLELIGFLMSDQPRVYVMDHLPRMDQISESDIPTRALNEFESAALKKLFAGQDLVVDEQPEQVKMVGALRSFEGCASCHDSQNGDLIGAFSYELDSN